MRNKAGRKLKLSRETVRTLESSELRVAGGDVQGYTAGCGLTPGSCEWGSACDNTKLHLGTIILRP